jgi:hypothetical protein
VSDSYLLDPFGRTIVLHDRTWFGHIVPKHPDVANDRNQVEEAIVRPIRIIHDPTVTSRRHYYGQGPRLGVMMIVVADVVGGFVTTAHVIKRYRGGAEEWSSPTP